MIVQVHYGTESVEEALRCPACHGAATGRSRPCKVCDGTGQNTDARTYAYEVPDDTQIGDLVICPPTEWHGEQVGRVVADGRAGYDGPVRKAVPLNPRTPVEPEQVDLPLVGINEINWLHEMLQEEADEQGKDDSSFGHDYDPTAAALLARLQSLTPPPQSEPKPTPRPREVVLRLTTETARIFASGHGKEHWKLEQQLMHMCRQQLAGEEEGEPVMTRSDVLDWLRGCCGKEPSGADMVEFVSARLKVEDDAWFAAIKEGE